MYKRTFHRNNFLLFVYVKKRSLHINGAQEIIHERSKVNNEKNKFKNIYVYFCLNKYININSLDSKNFIRTPIHYQKYKELVDSIKCASNVRLQNIHLIRKIINSLEVYIINYLNNLKNYHNNDLYYNIQQYNLYDDEEQEITPNSITTILISLYKLRYRNVNFLKLLEKYIFMNKEYFKISHIHLILYIYSYFNTINNTFINTILNIILKNKEYLTNDNILNIFTSLFYINCKNEKTIDILIDYIITNELNFHINIIIYILNNLKKLNYEKRNIIEYFHPQIVNKLYMLNDEKNVDYVDPFFLKKNISNHVQDKNRHDKNMEVHNKKVYKDGSRKEKNVDINMSVKKDVNDNKYDNKKKNNNNNNNKNNNNKNNNYSNSCSNFQINHLDNTHLDSFYGSLHNEYIVENNCTDNYIYEYYNKNDIHDKKKRKIILLLDVIIYYKYFKEELLKVVYEYILKNLKTYDTQDIYFIISNIFNFHVYNFPYINLLNNKFLLSLCYNYIPIHKNCHSVLFLSLKLLMEKYKYYNIFIDNILFHKIKTEILTLQERQFLNLLSQYKNSHIIKYLCDISLIYCNMLIINEQKQNNININNININNININNNNNNDSNNNNNNNDYVGVIHTYRHIDNLKNSHTSNILHNQIHNDCIKKEKNNDIDYTCGEIKYYEDEEEKKKKCIQNITKHIITVKYNEQNKLLLFESDILLDLFFFYVELKYYKGIFLFLKSLFVGIPNFKEFDIFLFYKINNYHKYKENINYELDKYKHVPIYKKFNALEILQIYEYFKSCFSTYDDFIKIKKMLEEEVEEDHKNSMYHFYFRNEIYNTFKDTHTYISNINYNMNELLENNWNCKNQNNQKVQIVNDTYDNKVTSKYILTNSKINYISPNKHYNKYIVNKEKNKYNEETNADYKKKEISIPNSLYNNISIKYEKNKLFDINNYIYNILNNIFIYAPVDLFALHIHYYNSLNIKFLLTNIIYKLSYLNVNYLALVISKIYKLLYKEKENEYVVFLDFFLDYLLGQERNSDMFTYKLKDMDNKKINNLFNINANEKRTLIDIIYNNNVNKNIHDEKRIKKRIAYILYKNNNIYNSVHNDIIIDEEFLNTFFKYVVNKKKYNSVCSFYFMTNESLYLILNSLQIKKKKEKYIECIELITNIMIFRYIQYTYKEEEGKKNYSYQKEEYYNVAKNFSYGNDNLYVIKDIKNLQLHLNLSFDELAIKKKKKKKNYEHVQVNSKKVCKDDDDKKRYTLEDNNNNNNNIERINKKRENIYNDNSNIENKNSYISISCDDKEEIDKNVFQDNSIMKRFIEIYYRIIKVRYYHELAINKHIFRELCINNEYLDNHKFLSLLFFIYKYKFDEIKYIFMLQKRCFLYKELYYTHSNYRIISFLCKKLNIHIDDNIRTTPTKQTSYDYEK
ncbi:hypothetical protein PFHG_03732 [Plasmodium falciparum HB3]|uniref:Uncharacterized protein n=1 Tax=Plasmodium falciparum (isolate HB3) TaxID=137071 RepID=A0A0L7KGE0_PLAFX|nr:hypothetical protein PFHG_03732 [Plasmodium falciparum HB3]